MKMKAYEHLPPGFDRGCYIKLKSGEVVLVDSLATFLWSESIRYDVRGRRLSSGGRIVEYRFGAEAYKRHATPAEVMRMKLMGLV